MKSKLIKELLTIGKKNVDKVFAIFVFVRKLNTLKFFYDSNSII